MTCGDPDDFKPKASKIHACFIGKHNRFKSYYKNILLKIPIFFQILVCLKGSKWQLDRLSEIAIRSVEKLRHDKIYHSQL